MNSLWKSWICTVRKLKSIQRSIYHKLMFLPTRAEICPFFTPLTEPLTSTMYTRYAYCKVKSKCEAERQPIKACTFVLMQKYVGKISSFMHEKTSILQHISILLILCMWGKFTELWVVLFWSPGATSYYVVGNPIAEHFLFVWHKTRLSYTKCFVVNVKILKASVKSARHVLSIHRYHKKYLFFVTTCYFGAFPGWELNLSSFSTKIIVQFLQQHVSLLDKDNQNSSKRFAFLLLLEKIFVCIFPPDSSAVYLFLYFMYT